MSFATIAQRSVSQHRVLVEIDIGIDNEQHVNNGAGLWTVDFRNLYPWVDSSLLGGFSAQDTRPIGSVKVDGGNIQRAISQLDLSDTPAAYFYDGPIRRLWYTMPNFDEPFLHTVSIGQIFSYARGAFTPINGPVPVEGRLMNTPAPSESRDPLFFGRFRYPSISVQLQNGDGEFDTWGRDVDIYGNDVRILHGFENVDYSEYRKVFTGFMGPLNVSEELMSIGVSDKRKQLTKPLFNYATTNTNALTAIEEILAEAYNYTFDSTFYDLTAWNIAKALVANITLDYQKPAAVIDVIEYIASSVFGLFRIDADGLFSFKITDWTATPVARIPSTDILNAHSISYNPTEVVSSVRIGYARDWTAASGDQYTYYTDDSREETVFNTYKTYQEKTFDTALIDEAAAIEFASRVLDYVDTVRGTETITVPIAHYGTGLADLLWVESDRGAQPMLGMRSAEVLGLSFPGGPLMDLTIRTIGDTLSAGGLGAYYSFDAGDATDDSGNDNDGTLSGFGPVARYSFDDDDLTDDSGNSNDGTGATDITYENSDYGRQAIFNGTTSHFDLPSGVYDIFNPVNSFSVFCLITLDTLSPAEANGRIWEMQTVGSTYTARVLLDTVNGRFHIAVSDGSDSAVSASAIGSATLDPVSIVGVWDAPTKTATLYINGVAQTPGTNPAVGSSTPAKGWVGGIAAASNFDGRADEVRFFDYPLSQAEVSALDSRPTGPSYVVDGKAGRALSFDGDSKVTIPSGLPAGDISVALWFKAGKTGASRTLWSQLGGDQRFIFISTDDSLQWLARRANGTTVAFSIASASTWTADEWMHVVAVQDGTTTRIYVNAVLASEDSYADIYTSYDADGRLGVRVTTWFYDGLEDEARVYNRVLADFEIRELYDNPGLA